MLKSEYAALERIAASPLDVSELSASVTRDVHFLLGWKLVSVVGGQVMVSERGRELLGIGPLTLTEKMVGFDASVLGWSP